MGIDMRFLKPCCTWVYMLDRYHFVTFLSLFTFVAKFVSGWSALGLFYLCVL